MMNIIDEKSDDIITKGDAVKSLLYASLYMDLAHRVARMSYCKRLQVGAIAVKDGRIISMGWNGQPSGMDNCCEEDGKTLPTVLHAESNLLMKLASCHESAAGSTVYITHSPCMECAKLLYQAKVSEVFYSLEYRSKDGIDFLNSLGIKTWKMDNNRIQF